MRENKQKQHTVVALGVGRGACFLLELFREGLVVEEGPWIVEFAVPSPLKIYHGCHHVVHLFVADKGQQRGAGSIGVLGAGRIFARGSYEDSLRLAGSYTAGTCVSNADSFPSVCPPTSCSYLRSRLGSRSKLMYRSPGLLYPDDGLKS